MGEFAKPLSSYIRANPCLRVSGVDLVGRQGVEHSQLFVFRLELLLPGAHLGSENGGFWPKLPRGSRSVFAWDN